MPLKKTFLGFGQPRSKPLHLALLLLNPRDFTVSSLLQQCDLAVSSLLQQCDLAVFSLLKARDLTVSAL